MYIYIYPIYHIYHIYHIIIHMSYVMFMFWDSTYLRCPEYLPLQVPQRRELCICQRLLQWNGHLRWSYSYLSDDVKLQRWPNGFMKLSPVFSSAKASAIATAAVSSFIFIEFYWISCWIRWCLHNWGRYSPQRVPSRDILWSHQWSHPCRSAQEDLPNGDIESHFRWIITRRDRKI